MKPPPNPSRSAAKLRRRAEARLHTRRRANLRGNGDQKSDAAARRMVHEVQVHQVELEMQNAELLESRNRAETLLEKYTGLYDFAPIGYFSLDDQGQIQEVNRTGAALLGVERSLLLNRRLVRHLDAPGQRVFLGFFQGVLDGNANRVCEASLLKADGTPVWVSFHGICAVTAPDQPKECRVSVSDITALKKAEEARIRLNTLTEANEALKAEIVRRQAVENALRDSQKHQIHLLKQARLMHAQLRHLSHRILQTQEDERKRISRELHDEISQTLVGIHVHLERLAQEGMSSPARLKQSIVRTQHIVAKSVRVVHDFARGLRPAILDDLGLIATLHSFVKEYSKQTGIRVRFTAFAALDQLNSARRTVIYRVTQAALANVSQHAHASRVRITLSKHENSVHLEIADDGRAFNVDQVLHARKNKRLGLIGMRERVEMIGGTFAVDSTPGIGTTILVRIPINPRAS